LLWLGVLGKWDLETRVPGREHITNRREREARGGHTIDFRRLAAAGLTLLGMTEACKDGTLTFKPDLAENVAQGDANYLAVLDEADAYALHNGLDLPEEPDARVIGSDPECMTNPDASPEPGRCRGENVFIWATGLQLGTTAGSRSMHSTIKGARSIKRGVSSEPGIYFLGLPWQSRRDRLSFGASGMTPSMLRTASPRSADISRTMLRRRPGVDDRRRDTMSHALRRTASFQLAHAQ